MQFSASAGDFLRALNFVHTVVERRTTIPILTHVLLETQDGRLSITGSDLERECVADAPAEIEANGRITVNGSILRDIVSRLPKAATMTVRTTGANEITLSFARNRYRMQTLDAADFPLTKDRAGVHFKIDAKSFAAILEATIGSVSTEETRFYLCGIYLHVRDGALYATSTDGHRMAVRSMSLPAGADAIPGVIIPSKSVHTLLSLLEAAEGEISVWLKQERMWIETPQARFSTGLIAGQFPDYQRAIPQFNGATATFCGEEFCAAVERAEKALADTKQVAAGLEVTRGGIVLRTGKQGEDAAVEHIDAEIHADAVPTSANTKYLAEMTKAWGPAPISMHIVGRGQPIVFTSTALPEQLYIVMPCSR